MSYRYDQKVGKHIYVYEIVGYWDKEKQQARQHRVLIGKRDPESGEIITRSSRRLSREYGPVYFLWHILDQLGIPALLQSAFTEASRAIILSACFQVAEQRPLYLCDSWLDRIYLREPFRLPSAEMSRLLKELGEDELGVKEFIEAWSSRQENTEFIVFDITSISSYSQGVDFVEWGYNRDHEPLAQVNLGVVYGEPRELPLLYALYPGSVTDVKTLRNIVTTLATFKVPTTVFVLDKGFYSRKNLAAIEGMKFVIPVPMTNKELLSLIDRRRAELSLPEHAFRFDKQILSAIEDTLEIGGRSYRALCYLNGQRSLDERNGLLSFLLEVEEYVQTNSSQSVAALAAELDEQFPDWRRYLRIEERRGHAVISRDTQAITQRLEHAGIMVLITNTNLSAEQALEFYRKKDGVEKLFDSMKHGIDLYRLRIHSRTALKGLLFINFISLILYAYLQRTLRTTGLGKQLTVNELFFELKKLSVIEIGAKTPMVTEVTKKQRDIFKAFQIPLPSHALL